MFHSCEHRSNSASEALSPEIIPLIASASTNSDFSRTISGNLSTFSEFTSKQAVRSTKSFCVFIVNRKLRLVEK